MPAVARSRTPDAAVHGVVLALSCLASFELVTHLLARVYSLSVSDDLLGGMWAVIATAFVYRAGRQQTFSAALTRMAATTLAMVLCLGYLALFPFHAWGLALLIGIGASVMIVVGRPDDVITTVVTVAVVLVVADLSPRHAWEQPILRLVDTAVGVAVGLGASWLGFALTARRQR
ncbi:MAG TPA: FUSC family protein [Acidimicrobiales bacterium]|nr:FUSC family protein [Acidimicrobiales bacterium]